MKRILLQPHRVERVIASFGRARLIRQFNGSLELRDGSPSDRQEAREWISLFQHESLVSEAAVR